MRRLLLVILLLQPRVLLADADRVPRLKTGPATSIQAYGRQNPTCREWTNGCVVCIVANGHSQCSTPGIACTPAGITCKRHAEP